MSPVIRRPSFLFRMQGVQLSERLHAYVEGVHKAIYLDASVEGVA